MKPLIPIKLLFDEFKKSRIKQLALGFLILGLVVRLVRYLVCFPLWPDEGFLAANFIPGGFSHLLGPLAFHQVAPLLFLWLEAASVLVLGFSEYALRLVPFLFGVAGLFLFYRLARKTFPGLGGLLALAIMAVSYYPIRHGAEVKPYSVDLAVSVLFYTLVFSWLHRPSSRAPLWGLVFFAPVAVGLSFPAAFVGGGISIVLLILSLKNPPARLASICLVATLAIGFLLVFHFSTGPQVEAERWLRGEDPSTRSFNRDQAWVKTFPPLRQPVKFWGWMIQTHTGRMFAYPNGGTKGGCAPIFVLFLTGVFVLYRRNRQLLALLLAPFLLGFIAAALHRYPYGFSARFNLYLAPAICWLTGLGASRLICFIRSSTWKRRIAFVLILILALVGIVTIARDIIQPYKNIEDVHAREFARQFWQQDNQDAEILCVYRDWGLEFFPRLFHWGHSSRYLCHQAIFRAETEDWDLKKVTGEHPLRCVVFSVPSEFEPYAVRDEEKFQLWLGQMAKKYDLIDHQYYQVNPGVEVHHETYEVFEFVPRSEKQRRNRESRKLSRIKGKAIHM